MQYWAWLYRWQSHYRLRPSPGHPGGTHSADQQGINWLCATHDYTGQRFVDLNEITPQNVKNLRPVAIFQASELGPVQTNPLVYDGVMYLTTAHTVVALDAATARRKWEYVWKPKDKENYNTNRGAAIKDGLVVRGTPDGYLIALDAATGGSAGKGKSPITTGVSLSACRR